MSSRNELNAAKPFVSLAVAVNEQGERLLVRRARDPHKDDWAFIGGVGASKKGLPPEEAIQDEVLYDIGTELLGAKLVFEYPLHNADYADRVYVFMGRVAAEAIQLNLEAASEFRWFGDDDLKDVDVAFDGKWVIEEVRKRRNQ